ASGACALWMLLGNKAREEGALLKAAAYYERAQKTGSEPQASFDALRGVLEITGNIEALIAALERYVAADEDTVDPEVRNEALFRLAEHNLCGGVDRERGVELLTAALLRNNDYRRAANILETAAEHGPATRPMVQLADEVANKLEDKQLLLKAAFWGADDIPLDRLAASVELAGDLGHTAQKPLLHEKLAARAREEHVTDRLLTALTALA